MTGPMPPGGQGQPQHAGPGPAPGAGPFSIGDRVTRALGGTEQDAQDARRAVSDETARLLNQEHTDLEVLKRKATLLTDRRARQELDAQDRQPIVLVSAAEVRKRQPPPYLVEDLIPAYGIGVFFGESGTYKSFLVLNLLLCVGATSAAFLGHMVSGPPGWGIYVMGEGQYDAGLRLDAAVKANIAFSDERLRYIEQAFPLSDEAAVSEVIAAGKELARTSSVPVRLVVFDSFADFYGAGDSENSNTDMQRLIASMKKISAELGCVVMANAHTGHGGTDEDGNDKPPPTRLRGASRFRQAWDFELMATGSSLRPTKNRYGPLAPSMGYQMSESGGSLVVGQGSAVAQEEAEAVRPLAPEWPHPVTIAQVGRVIAAVHETPGMTMTDVAKAAEVKKASTSMALLRAAGIGAVTNAGTRDRPRYEPGPLRGWIAGVEEWLAAQEAGNGTARPRP